MDAAFIKPIAISDVPRVAKIHVFARQSAWSILRMKCMMMQRAHMYTMMA